VTAQPSYADLLERIAGLEQTNGQLRHALDEYRSMVDKYRTLAESSLAGIYVTQNGRFQYVNPRLVEMLGYNREEDLIGLDFLDIVHPDDQTGPFQVDPDRPHTAFPARYTFRALRQDGSVAWLDLRGMEAKYMGQPANIGTVIDVTEQRETEEALRQSEEKYRTIIDHIEDGYYEVDLRGSLVFFNDSFARIWGYPRNELMGMNYRHYTRAEDARQVNQTFRKVFTTGRPQRAISWQIVRKDGTRRYIELSVSLIKDQDGRSKGFRGIARDITERREVEEELKKHRNHLEDLVRERTDELVRANELLQNEVAERQLAEVELRREKRFSDSVIDSLPGAFYVFDWFGKFLRWNENMEMFTGYSKEEIAAMNAMDFFAPDYKEEVSERIKETFQDGRSMVEADLMAKDGTRIPYILTGVRSVLDGRTYLVGVGFDITERKKAEQALIESEKELRILSAQLIRAQEMERQRVARELHDGLGQALTAAKVSLEGALKTIERQAGPDTGRPLHPVIPMIQDAVEEVRRMSMDLRPSMLDDLGIRSTMSWFCRNFQKIYTEITILQDIDILETDVPEDLKIVIYRIIQEALNNVAKHSRATLVKISLGHANGIMALEIKDNGRGFDLHSIMRGDPDARGFGLASMRERTELSGGRYNIQTNTGQGTTITAEWPA
jgi:PAS domain S-box-containing protein